MAFAALAVENWQPCLTLRIKPFWSDFVQFARGRRLAVFTVDVQQFLCRDFIGKGLRDRANPPEAAAQGINNSRNSLFPQPRNRGESATVRRGFQIFQAVNTQIAMKTRSLYPADSGNRPENCLRVHFAPETVEHREPSGDDQIPQGNGDPITNSRQFPQASGPFFFIDLGYRDREM